MKINKNSWHYRLVRWGMEADFYSKLRCCNFDDSMMPRTICAYSFKLLEVFLFALVAIVISAMFLTMAGIAVYIAIFEIFMNPMVVCCGVLGFLILILLPFGLSALFGYLRDYAFLPIKQWQDKHCQKVNYT